MLEPCGEEKQPDMCEMHSKEIVILGLKGDLKSVLYFCWVSWSDPYIYLAMKGIPFQEQIGSRELTQFPNCKG